MTLADYITANLQKPFVWGELDCVLFCSRWAQLKTGIDYLQGVPQWTDEKQAMRTVKKMGGMVKILDDRLDRINPHLAKDGDIALYNNGMYLFSGSNIVAPFYTGLASVSRMKADMAWSLPN